MSRSAVARLYDKCMFKFLKDCQTILRVALPFYSPRGNMCRSSFSTLTNVSRSVRCVVMSLHGLRLHFPIAMASAVQRLVTCCLPAVNSFQ